MAGLHAPLSTLRRTPHGMMRMTRGRCGSLHLHCNGLAPSTPYRSPGALHKFPLLEAPPNTSAATATQSPVSVVPLLSPADRVLAKFRFFRASAPARGLIAPLLLPTQP